MDIHKIDADVCRLIGSNVPKALEPLEVVNNQNDGPFACRCFGWMVYGCTQNDRCTSRIGSFTGVRIKEDIQQQLDKLYQRFHRKRLIYDLKIKIKVLGG